MLIYSHTAIIRKAVKVSINISVINLTSSDDRADNPMRQLKDEYCLKESAKIQRICLVVSIPFPIKDPVLKYTQIENSLLQTIVYLAKEGRILKEKNKRKRIECNQNGKRSTNGKKNR